MWHILVTSASISWKHKQDSCRHAIKPLSTPAIFATFKLQRVQSFVDKMQFVAFDTRHGEFNARNYCCSTPISKVIFARSIIAIECRRIGRSIS
jgi:hypothetical protein